MILDAVKDKHIQLDLSGNQLSLSLEADVLISNMLAAYPSLENLAQ